jgi:trimethylamine--corrinoid protein Co-methyltransferase
MIPQPCHLLTAEQVQTLHEAALTILEETGLLVRNEAAREVFGRHGCRVDAETGIVRLPRAVVEQWRQSFPARFHLYGRDPQYDVVLPDDGPLIANASACPNVIDLESGERRRAVSADLARIAHLINGLPGFDVFSVATLVDDAPEGQYSLSRFYPTLKNCVKPVMSGVPTPQDVDTLLRLGSIIAGGEAAYRERPFMTHLYASTVSPLTMDVDSTAISMYCARRKIPALSTVVPNGGLTAPVTLAGTLAVANAEFLAGNVLPQMVREGTPVMYYALPTIADMRTGAYASGGIECGILHMACAQLARFYGVPCGGYLGLTNAKTSDAQAGFEKGMSPLAGMLAGADLLAIGGLIDTLMTFSFPQAVIDSEIGEMIKRVHRGISFDEDRLALDLIREKGPGATYVGSPHTARHMRTEAYVPAIADRRSQQAWSKAGGLDAHARAMRYVWEILSADNPAVFSADVDAAIRATFEGLVAGDSRPPSAPPAA